MYAVEHFLQGLLQRKCVFHLVFFNVHERLCIPRATSPARQEKYLLARAIIMRHLTNHLPQSHPNIKIFTFESALDRAFQNYLTASGAYFIMTHDGANTLPLNEDSQFLDSQDLDLESIRGEEMQRRVTFRTTIYHFIAQGYNIALIDGLEWMDTKVKPSHDDLPKVVLNVRTDYDDGC